MWAALAVPDRESACRAWHHDSITPPTIKFLAKQNLIYTAALCAPPPELPQAWPRSACPPRLTPVRTRRSDDGRLWASAFWGLPGFLHCPKPSVLAISPLNGIPGDPAQLTPGTLLGTTAISLQVRHPGHVHAVTVTGARVLLAPLLGLPVCCCKHVLQDRQQPSRQLMCCADA